METKTIEIKVPKSFVMPSYLQMASPEQTEHALKLADALLEAGIYFHQNYDKKHLQERIKQLESTTVESAREEALRIAKAELRAEVHGTETLVLELRKQISNKERDFEDLKQEKQKLEQKLTVKEQKVEELQGKLEAKKLALANPQKKGVYGELEFKDLAKKVLGWNLEPTGNASKHHQTDWKYKYNDANVYFEIKKYEDENKKEKAVPNKEYEKFVKDMNANLEIDIGFYISLDIPIAFTNDMKIEYTSSNQMLVIVPKFMESEDKIYSLLHQFALLVLVAKRYRKLLETNDVDGKNNTKLKRISTYTTNMMNRIKNGKKDYDLKITQLQQAVDSLKQSQDSFFASLIQDAASTLAILCDDEKYVEPVEETEQPLNLPNLAKEKKKRNTKAKIDDN